MEDRWQVVSDLERQYVNQVLDDLGRSYSLIDLFEQEVREFVGTKHALLMCNGTATVHSALFASGARQGSEVIVPSVTGTPASPLSSIAGLPPSSARPTLRPTMPIRLTSPDGSPSARGPS